MFVEVSAHHLSSANHKAQTINKLFMPYYQLGHQIKPMGIIQKNQNYGLTDHTRPTSCVTLHLGHVKGLPHALVTIHLP